MRSDQTLQDVIIIGAGVSGIGLACTLRRECPRKRLLVLEQRADVGGTWDLFRYPGIRSDSDMFSFSYAFKPWTQSSLLADGPSIKRYVRDAANENGVSDLIRFQRQVVSAEWASDIARWTVTVDNLATGEREIHLSRFVFFCTGYYRHEAGYRPHFPGEEDFKGPIIQPQHWPEDLDCRGKKVVIIGSGATAITLVPTLAAEGAQVTMLQRSPGYVLSVPSVDLFAQQLQRWLPERMAYHMNRTRNIFLHRTLYQACKRHPKVMRRLMLAQVKHHLQGKVDMRHFTPDYMPWDQRLCVVPNGDLFKVLRDGRADIVTDHIDHFTADGIRLRSGQEIKADIVISATGLNAAVLNGMELVVDGEPVRFGERMLYKGVLIEGVPNAGLMFGYINLSWTLRVNIASDYLCRLIKYMDRQNHHTVRPVDDGDHAESFSFVDGLSSGYIRRSSAGIPRQGSEGPWHVCHDYMRDYPVMKFGAIADDCLRFDLPVPAQALAS